MRNFVLLVISYVCILFFVSLLLAGCAAQKVEAETPTKFRICDMKGGGLMFMSRTEQGAQMQIPCADGTHIVLRKGYQNAPTQ